MTNFADQLTAARKAKAMTQEQLAKAVHISRSRISRWETGDAVPDLNMIRQLSEVLECDFLVSQAKNEPASAEVPAPADAPAPAEESPAPEVTESADEPVDPQPETPKPAAKKRWLPAAIVGVIVLAAVLLILLLPGKEAPVPEEVYTPYSLEWFQQEVQPAEGCAYVTVTPEQNPTKAIRMEDFQNGVGWFYAFHCNEVTGIPFTVHTIKQSVFNEHGSDTIEFTGEDLLSVMQNDLVLRPDRPDHMAFCGGFPLQNVTGVGLALEGVDANGHEMIFHGYMELSQEIEE